MEDDTVCLFGFDDRQNVFRVFFVEKRTRRFVLQFVSPPNGMQPDFLQYMHSVIGFVMSRIEFNPNFKTNASIRKLFDRIRLLSI